MVKKLDIDKLEKDARTSCVKESYVILEKNPVFRLGAGAKINDDNKCGFFLVTTIDLCPGKPMFSTLILERSIRFVKEMMDVGYDFDCDYGLITCEKTMESSELNSALEMSLKKIDELGLAWSTVQSQLAKNNIGE